MAQHTDGETISLERARWCIRWGTTRGINQLCLTGPTDRSKISDQATVELRQVTAVLDVTPSAAEKFHEWSQP